MAQIRLNAQRTSTGISSWRSNVISPNIYFENLVNNHNYDGQRITGSTFYFYTNNVEVSSPGSLELYGINPDRGNIPVARGYGQPLTTGYKTLDGTIASFWNTWLMILSNNPYFMDTHGQIGNIQITGNNPMYLLVDTDPVPVGIRNMRPVADTILSGAAENTFSYDVYPIDTYGFIIRTPQQRNGFIQWRVQGTETVNNIYVPVTGTSINFTVPRDTFPVGNIEYRILCYSNGGYVVNTAWQALTITDTVSNPIPISPNDVVTDTNGVQFTWQHNISTGTLPTASNLQYSTNNGSSWIELVTINGSAQTWRSPHRNIPTGSILWRVRTRNTINTWSPFSAAIQAIIRIAQNPPILTYYPGIPKPIFRWTSTEQSGFQLQLIDENGDTIHDSGQIYSNGREYVYPDLLQDGNYTVQVRTINIFGDISGWGTAELQVTNNPGQDINLMSRTTHKNTVELKWTSADTYQQYIIYRNDKPIATISGAIDTYEDCNSNGKNYYYIIGLIDPNYTMSNICVETICPCHAQISLLNSNDIQCLKYRRGGYPIHSEMDTPTVVYQHYENRDFPVVYRSIQNTIIHNFEFSFKNRKDYEKLLTMQNQTVVYKDCKKNLVIGNLEIQNIDHTRCYDVQFTITVTDEQGV